MSLVLLTAAEACAQGSARLTASLVEVDIESTVTHIDLGLFLSESAHPSFKVETVTLKLTNFTPVAPEPLDPAYVCFLKNMADRLQAKWSRRCGPEAEPTLRAHRKLGGLSVHGPLVLTGRLYLSWDPCSEGGARMTATIDPWSLKGPKGSWPPKP